MSTVAHLQSFDLISVTHIRAVSIGGPFICYQFARGFESRDPQGQEPSSIQRLELP